MEEKEDNCSREATPEEIEHMEQLLVKYQMNENPFYNEPDSMGFSYPHER